MVASNCPASVTLCASCQISVMVMAAGLMPCTSAFHSRQKPTGTIHATSSRQPSTPRVTSPSGAIQRRVTARM